MTDTEASAKADPTAIDLEPYKQRRAERYPDQDGPIDDSDDDIDDLIVAVEALRERVAGLEADIRSIDNLLARRPALDDKPPRFQKITYALYMASRAEAAEARVAELENVIQEALGAIDCYPDRQHPMTASQLEFRRVMNR